MNHSEKLDELAAALSKAQAVMTGALKDSANPFFKSKYADLESVWQACRKALTDNGLSVVQYGSTAWQQETDSPIRAGTPVLVTRLLHSSGQWIEGNFPIRAKDDTPQAEGSGITYARRYGLAAMVGVYQTDDDAEAAQGRPAQPQSDPSVEFVATYVAAFRDRLAKRNDPGVLQVHEDLQAEGQDKYSSVWQKLGPGERSAIKDAIDRARGAKGKF